jgi:hypothetical protein
MSRPRKQEQGEFALMDQLYEANTKVSSMFQCSLLSFRGAANEVNGDRVNINVNVNRVMTL